MPPPPSQSDRELDRLEADLRRLEAEYTMFFSGRTARPPSETRARVSAALKQFDRTHTGNTNTSHRFRFNTIQARFASFSDLWDRALRAREEGRAGPLSQKKEERRPEPRAGGTGHKDDAD